MMVGIKPEYLAQAEQLTEEEAERLLSRMSGKLPRRLDKGKISRLEALAIQMELEDEQLHEWRAMMQKLKDKEAARAAEKAAIAQDDADAASGDGKKAKAQRGK